MSNTTTMTIANVVALVFVTATTILATDVEDSRISALPPAAQSADSAGTEHRSDSSIRKRIIPWLEVNSPTAEVLTLVPGTVGAKAGQINRDFFVASLAHWSKVSNAVIVTTRVGNSRHLYPYVMSRKPENVHIIGGFKTSILPGATARSAEEQSTNKYLFADEKTWLQMASEAREITRTTGNNVIVLENEGALWRFNTGKASIDIEKLYRSLAPMRETGIQFWIYLPSILENTPNVPNREKETERLFKAVAKALPGSVFFGTHTAWHGWRSREGDVRRRRAEEDIVGADSIHEMLYVGLDGYTHLKGGRKRRCYTPTELLAEVDRLPGQVFIVYPGAKRWMPVGNRFETLLSR